MCSRDELIHSIKAKARQTIAEAWIGPADVSWAQVTQLLIEKLTDKERGVLLEGAAANVLYRTPLANTAQKHAPFN